MGDFWGPGNVPFLYPGTGYMDVFTIQKLTELQMYDPCDFLHYVMINNNNNNKKFTK